MATHYRIGSDSAIMLDPPQTGTRHGERRQGEDYWVEQERLTDEEKAERARKMLERMQQKEI